MFTSLKIRAISLTIQESMVITRLSVRTQRRNDLTIQMRQCNRRVIGIQKPRGIRLKIHYHSSIVRRGIARWNCSMGALISDLSAIRRPARPNFRDRNDNNDKPADNKSAGG